jgi:Peptidase propeptide and YPEB domain
LAVVRWPRAARPMTGETAMNRIASLLLAGAVLAASGGLALAAPGSAARTTQALNLLEAKGYGSFSNFKQDGADFEATVKQNGQSFTVTVNPDTGQITRQG